MISARDLLDAEGSAGLFVFFVELSDGGPDEFCAGEVHQLGEAAGGQWMMRAHQERLEQGEIDRQLYGFGRVVLGLFDLAIL